VNAGSFFTVNGTPQAGGASLYIPVAQLGTVQYVAGSQPGTEYLTAQARASGRLHAYSAPATVAITFGTIAVSGSPGRFISISLVLHRTRAGTVTVHCPRFSTYPHYNHREAREQEYVRARFRYRRNSCARSG